MDLDRLRIRAVSFADTHLELPLAGGRTVRGGLRRHHLFGASAEQRAVLPGWKTPELRSCGDIPRLLSEAERTRIGDELDPAFWDSAEGLPLRVACHDFNEG